MNTVNFKPTNLVDPVKYGSALTVDKPFKGELSQCKTKVYWTDSNGLQWIFYVGDTCVLL